LKRLIRTLLILLTLHSSLEANEWSSPSWWQQSDKQLHFATSMIISGSIYAYLKSQKQSDLDAYIYAVGITFLLGWSKEQFDGAFGGTKEIGDIDANTFGALSGASVMFLFYRIEF
jgi:uncharacterized protein YfiM (DUF2279 family)